MAKKLLLQTGDEMAIDPRAPAIDRDTVVGTPPSQTTVTDGMVKTNYDADQSDNYDGTDDEDYDTSDSDDDEDSSDSSVHTPTSVISHSLISSYSMIDGVSSNSEASSDGNAVEIYVLAECRTCNQNYIVLRGTIVCSQCGYACLVHFRDNL
jgi:hypothetical protein